MKVSESIIPLSDYCNVICRIERFGSAYSATISWTGEFFSGEEIIKKTWGNASYEEALDSLKQMVADLELMIMRLDRAVVRFSEGDNKAY